jgi:hypothetical protein
MPLSSSGVDRRIPEALSISRGKPAGVSDGNWIQIKDLRERAAYTETLIQDEIAPFARPHCPFPPGPDRENAAVVVSGGAGLTLCCEPCRFGRDIQAVRYHESLAISRSD